MNAIAQNYSIRNSYLCTARQSALRPFTGRPQTSQSTFVFRQVLLVLTLEFLNKVVNHSVVEVLSTKMGVTRC